ncbi:MAG: hypothetical protein ACE5FP_06285 [Gemmatimonadota bacterium]
MLVSDELGGEGRNFQTASAIVHLDQPWAAGRLEQRSLLRGRYHRTDYGSRQANRVLA